MAFLSFGGPSRKAAPATDQEIESAIQFGSPVGFVEDPPIGFAPPDLTPAQMAWALAALLLLIRAARK